MAINELFDEPAAPVAAPRRSPAKRSQGHTLYDKVFPQWARDAATIVQGAGVIERVVFAVLGVGVLVPFGFVLVFGNAIASIKGLQWALSAVGLISGVPGGIPALAWWLLPAALFLVQTFARHYTPLRWMWRPSIAFDAVTTAVFISLGIVAFLASAGRMIETPILAAISAPLGLGVAVLAERVFMGAICVTAAAIRVRS